jgi:chromosome segregation ATPase
VFNDPPQTVIYLVGGAFVLGWVVAKIGAAVSRRVKARERDPRDDRIRNLEAELRIAQGEVEKLKVALEQQEQEVAKAQKLIEAKDEEALKQTGVIEKLNQDLKESVMKTRELRAELTDRATENVKSEVKLREVETELEVAQASSEMITTGVLDYDMVPDTDKEDTGKRRRKSDKLRRRGTDFAKSGT